MKTFINVLKTIGFILSYFLIIVITGILFPMKTAVKADSSTFGALFLELAVNSFFIIYLLNRLSLKGWRLIAVTALSVYGLQIFMTQIETWVFIKSFPQITMGWLFTIFSSNLFQTFTITAVGYFLWRPAGGSPSSKTIFPELRKSGLRIAILSVTYVFLYFFFGFFVAWQVAELRDFYRNTVVNIGNVQLAFIQVVRGAMWVLFCLPVLINLKGGRLEKYLIISLMMALLPTILLMMPNPYMPFPIRMAHFVEIFLSNGIFGFLITFLMTYTTKRTISFAPRVKKFVPIQPGDSDL
jgi:hypothetical protein